MPKVGSSSADTPYINSTTALIQFSACVATVADLSTDADAVLKAAYAGLQDAKCSGKNTVVFRTLAGASRSRRE